MCENTSGFSSVKVGDKLWSAAYGECEVTDKGPSTLVVVPTCDTMRRISIVFFNDGTTHGTAPQSLFWSRPEIIAPPKPKRKVMKTVEAWANVYPSGKQTLHDSMSDAITYRCLNVEATVKIVGAYEVEE